MAGVVLLGLTSPDPKNEDNDDGQGDPVNHKGLQGMGFKVAQEEVNAPPTDQGRDKGASGEGEQGSCVEAGVAKETQELFEPAARDDRQGEQKTEARG